MSRSGGSRHHEWMGSIAVDTAGVAAPTFGVANGASERGPGLSEDGVLCGPTWFAIAGGIGGRDHEGASRVALDALASNGAVRSVGELAACIQLVDGAVRSAARRAASHDMAATLVAATSVTGGVAIVHLGDTRCYRLLDGVLTLLTRDHSYAQELVDLGRLTPDDARHHRLRRVVTRALGIDGATHPDTSFVPAPVGRLLLCSDGLSAELSPQTIGRVLAGVVHPQAAADRLVGLVAQRRDPAQALVIDHLGAAS